MADLQFLSDEELKAMWELRRDRAEETGKTYRSAQTVYEAAHQDFIEIEREYARRKREGKK